jgi:hypothetical protein
MSYQGSEFDYLLKVAINLILLLGVCLWARKKFPRFNEAISRLKPARQGSERQLAKDARREAMYKKYDEELERGE